LQPEIANTRYFYLQFLQFNLAILVSACQDITFKANTILDKLLGAIQQLQVQRLAPDFLQGPTILKLFKHLKLQVQNGKLDLLILAPSDLFQIDGL
jgi:hypothetical protein